ncbi:MAG: hypothetical protein KDA96_08870 [Planctomycetaceae bacterium]|nr:hypothetical protein [Planctomycetaceae bacterium]
MAWLTENPWPLILIFAGAAIVSFVTLAQRRFTMTGSFLAAAVVVYVVEMLIVTPGERLEQDMQVILDGFRQDDIAAIESRISQTAPELKSHARQVLDLVQLGPGFHMEDIQVQIDASGIKGTARLRANGTVSLKRGEDSSHVATMWQTEWVLEDNVWKLTAAKRLDPVSGNEMGYFSAW